jgi:hypothetical protein
MVLTQKPLSLDRDLQPLNVGDHVRFIARGFFHPREQESFGKIVSIDDFGGVEIRMIAGYKHFLSSKKIGHIGDTFYFTHHHYDAEKHARVYFVKEGPYELFISIFECYKDPET